MRLRLLAIGSRMPGWVQAGFEAYARRLPADNRLILVELAAARQGAGRDVVRRRREEAERLLGAVRGGERIVALDRSGRALTTEDLTGRLRAWRMEGRDVALLVGGPDGLDASCLEAAELVWSLSPLTLPHALVRVVVAEQLYRTWTVIASHPYHR